MTKLLEDEDRALSSTIENSYQKTDKNGCILSFSIENTPSRLELRLKAFGALLTWLGEALKIEEGQGEKM